MRPANLVIITDHVVKKLYGKCLADSLKAEGHHVMLLSFPCGEQSKTNKMKQYLEEKMLNRRFGRDTTILALGGGVVGDLAGFIAATYMRGIQYIHIPTTLLAMIDSSIGGKTGINTPQGKNLIGAFWQPQAVIADIRVLKTLPQKHMINGLVEALKIFLIRDKKNFHYFIKHLKKIVSKDEKILTRLICRSIQLKCRVVERDEKENNERMVLNFGHTIGHALEKISDYKILHGYAVAYGILVESKISQLLGILNEKNFFAIQAVMKQLGIMPSYLKKYNVKKIITETKQDKKNKLEQTHIVLLKEIGSVYHKNNRFAHPISDHTVEQAIRQTIEGS